MSKYNTKHSKVEGDASHQAISSYFLGPRAENFEYLRSNILTILEEQRETRLDYFPEDGVSEPLVSIWIDSEEKLAPSEIASAVCSMSCSCKFFILSQFFDDRSGRSEYLCRPSSFSLG